MPKASKPKASKNTKKDAVEVEQIVVASVNPEYAQPLVMSSPTSEVSAINLGHRLRPQNLVLELDSILKRISALEEAIKK